MPAAKVVDFPKTPPQDDPLADLLEERAELEAERSRLAAVDKTRAAAEAALAVLDNEQAQIDQAERSSWSAWAQTPEGAAPAPLVDRRQRLAQKRVRAASELAGALNGARGVAPRLEALNEALRAVEQKIFGEKLSRAIAEALALNEGIHANAAALRQAIMRLNGLSVALAQLGEQHQHDAARAGILQEARGKFDALLQPRFDADSAQISQTVRKLFPILMAVAGQRATTHFTRVEREDRL